MKLIPSVTYNLGIALNHNSPIVNIFWLNRYCKLLYGKNGNIYNEEDITRLNFRPQIACEGKNGHPSSYRYDRFRRELSEADRTYIITCKYDLDSLTILLPLKDNKREIKSITRAAILFARVHEGSETSVRKKLTENGYHIRKS